MSTDLHQEAEQIKVPEKLVLNAIQAGITNADQPKKKHRKVWISVAAAAAAVVLIGVPVAGASGLMPNILPNLDQKKTGLDGERRVNFDPTTNRLLEKMFEEQKFQQLDISQKNENGETIKLSGLIVAPGVIGIVYDYYGNKWDIKKFNNSNYQNIFIHEIGAIEDPVDITKSETKVDKNHYRFISTFNPSSVDLSKPVKFDFSVKDGKNSFSFKNLETIPKSIETVQVNKKLTTKYENKELVGRVTNISLGEDTLAIDYQNEFNENDFDEQHAKSLEQAWVSRGIVYSASGKELGDVDLVIGGTDLDKFTKVGIRTSKHRSIFTTSYSNFNNNEGYKPLKDLPKDAVIKFEYETAGEKSKKEIRRHLGSVEVKIGDLYK